MSVRNLMTPYSNAYEKKYGKLHFVAGASATDLNIVVNTGNNRPDSRLLSVWINGHITNQLYNSISFSAGDDVQIRMVPWQGDSSTVTHFGSGRFFPAFSWYNKNYVQEMIEYPDTWASATVRESYGGNKFYQNYLLQYIQMGLFRRNVGITSFGSNASSGAFQGCSSLTSIPAGLFDNNTAVTSFSYTFSACSSLTSIPTGLFDNNTAVVNFERIFSSCSNLTSIPAGLFDNNTAVTSFAGTFSSCSSLTSIPTGLFDNNTSAISFSYTFSDCSSLQSIPAGLFDNNTAVTSFSALFRNCSNLTSIPSGLFDNNPLVTTFQWTFYGSNITSIPSGLFSQHTAVTNFYLTFAYCPSLRSFELNIPAEGVTNAAGFCSKNTAYTRIIHVKAGTTTEATFQSVASSCGLTIVSDL